MNIPVITLTVTNTDYLPDGGPTSYSAQGGAFQIGRDAQREWTLPDPGLFISGNHCTVQFDGQAYLLTDTSRNGTFVNGSQSRVKSPYRLQDGDTVAIGHYIISVRIAARAGQELASDSWIGQVGQDDEDIWGGPAVASPAERRAFSSPAKEGYRAPGFVESYLDMPQALPAAAASPHARPDAAKPAPASPSVRQHQFPPVTPAGQLQSGEARGVPRSRGQAEDFLAAFSAGAQLPPTVWQGRNPEDTAREIGAILLLVTEQVSQLLKARSSAKSLARASDRTMIGAIDNNPLKFLPNANDAMEAMFAENRPGYLDALRAFRQAFDDLKTHEIATYAAMQKALARLLADFAPETIEAKVEKSTFANRKAKAWDAFVSRWEAKTDAHENGMLDVFLMYFAEAYEEASRRQKP
jgi:type VI secretion system protein ImpI